MGNTLYYNGDCLLKLLAISDHKGHIEATEFGIVSQWHWQSLQDDLGSVPEMDVCQYSWMAITIGTYLLGNADISSACHPFSEIKMYDRSGYLAVASEKKILSLYIYKLELSILKPPTHGRNN